MRKIALVVMGLVVGAAVRPFPKRLLQHVLFGSLVFFCLHLAADSVPPKLPAEATINKDAGRGNFLFLTLHLENGSKLPFIVDTGMPDTCLDMSLRSKLGKRIGREMYYMPGSEQKAWVYAAPKLYLADVPLMTSSNIDVVDFRWLSKECGRRILGAVGMDCLRNYCIQLNFQAGKMRFLDTRHLNAASLGKVFPLANRLTIQRVGFLEETNADLEIDTGCTIDGLLNPKLFRREFLCNQRYKNEVVIAECAWSGGTYTNLYFGTASDIPKNADLIGLRFLARHLVTLDFPNRTMYLKQMSVGPLH